MYKLNITNEDLKNIDIEDTNEYIKHIEKLTNIKWKIIPDYEDYIISEYGDIISIRSKKILNPSLDKNKYYRINLFKNNIRKTFRIHRLVYHVFINNKDIKEFDIHHKDENRTNNHYSNLQKIDHSNHKKYHWNQESEKYLNQYKKYYDSKYKDHLSTEEIMKKYNVSKTTVNVGIQKYKIYLSNNEDMNKYNSSNIKEKQDFYSNAILKENRKKYLKDYLRKCEQLYNKKNKEHLSNKELSKIYNLPEYTIRIMIRNIKVFIKILNRDFDKFYNLSKKEKEKLRNKNTKIERKEYVKEYLKKCEVIYNKKNKENLSNKELAKIYNLSISKINHCIQDIKLFIFLLDRNFNKFKALSKKEKLKLRKKITAINKWNDNVLYIGKQIEDLKLSGTSNRDIANKLNLSVNRISDIYKKYKKLINDNKIKDELKSIKNNNK